MANDLQPFLIPELGINAICIEGLFYFGLNSAYEISVSVVLIHQRTVRLTLLELSR